VAVKTLIAMPFVLDGVEGGVDIIGGGADLPPNPRALAAVPLVRARP
jgi:hypothetical protein